MAEPGERPTTEGLLALIDAMTGKPVVMAADLVADRFITGVPRRVSREAPVVILAWEGERLVPGGGGNAVANVAALGGRPLPLGAVGDDEAGRGVLAALEGLGVTTEGILVQPGYRTPTKTRILGGGAIKQQIVRYDIEDHLRLAPEQAQERRLRLEAWAREVPDLAVAILSDYGYGGAEPEQVGELRAALGPAATLLCDSRYRLAEFAGIDGATPNREEAEALLGASLGDSPGELNPSGRALAARLGVRWLLVTRGSRGMSLFAGGSGTHLPVHGTDQVADVTGAGDTVLGTFALALAAGAEPLEAALLADYAAGVVVMKAGTATLGADELREAVASDPAPLAGVRWAGEGS